MIPAEWEHHERTIMGWPCRLELWEDRLDEAKDEYAGVANAIAAFEPVLMIAKPGDGAEARAALTGNVEVWEAPIDDSWLRDSGPIFVGERAVCFGFNAWGGKFVPWDADAKIAQRVCAHLDRPFERSPMVLEGGAIAIDHEGRVITTEQCLLNPNRNPGWTRRQIEEELIDRLDTPGVIWLGNGLVEDRDTDGHVDLICVPTPEGPVMLQQVDEHNPNHDAMAENARRLDRAGIEVISFDVIAYDDEGTAMSYLNSYICNGAVIVPQSGDFELDERAMEIYAATFPDREPIGVPGLTLAYGGGGPHCITQQVPSV